MTMIPYYFSRLLPLAALGAAGIGVLLLQVWLCRRRQSLWGMVLPVLALFVMLDRAGMSPWALWQAPLRIRAVVCLPTLGLILVYYLCRCTRRRQAELRRMSIQDLE